MAIIRFLIPSPNRINEPELAPLALEALDRSLAAMAQNLLSAQEPHPSAEWWTTSEVAAYLGVGVATVSS
jgi:hypothetical protein